MCERESGRVVVPLAPPPFENLSCKLLLLSYLSRVAAALLLTLERLSVFLLTSTGLSYFTREAVGGIILLIVSREAES